MSAKLTKRFTNHNLYRFRMVVFMLLADVSGLILAILLSISIFQFFFNKQVINSDGIEHIVFLLSCMSLFISSRLYPGVGINPAEEIKLVFQLTFTSMAIGMIFDSILGLWVVYRFWTLFLVWVFSMVFILGFRWIIKIVAVRFRLWRELVVVVAKGKQASYLAHYFHQRLRLAFWPAVVASDEAGMASYLPLLGESVINIKDLPNSADLFSELGIETALVDLSAAGDVFGPNAPNLLPPNLTHVTLISDLNWLEGALLNLHDYEGLLGLEFRKNVLSRFNLGIKTAMDIILSISGLLFLLPFFLLVALIIKIDSAGSVFYLQERIGKGGRKIKIIKFRTMVEDAENILNSYLNTHPEAKLEWVQNQKLKDDPRITRPGKWLRRFSIDEIPQLINVFKGDMSLVGPRPMMLEQATMHQGIKRYFGVKPGLTGLWQVSGRNLTTFDERARYDIYYVHNWSIWLDIYILLRTILVTLRQEGAY